MTGSSAQCGQALVELAICCAVLIPLFLLIPLVAKYGHATIVAQQAARDAAWEATVAPSYHLPDAGQLRKRVLDRNFATADAIIRTTPTASASRKFGDPMLGTFSGRTLLDRDGVTVAKPVEHVSPGYTRLATFALKVNANRYVTSEVTMRYNTIAQANGSPNTYLAPLDSLDLVQTRRQSLLADAWNASGSRDGERRVQDTMKALAPAGFLSDLGLGGVFDALEPMGAVLPIVGELSQLDPGHLEPDIVPADRLAKDPATP